MDSVKLFIELEELPGASIESVKLFIELEEPFSVLCDVAFWLTP